MRTDYLWSGDVLLQEDRQALADKTERTSVAVSASHERVIYLHEPNSYRPLLQLRNTGTNNNSADQVYYYHLDHLGTPQELTDAEGRVVWQAQYRGFGRAKVVNASIDNPIRFLGQYEDSEVGLHYNRYRYYDPGSGQYTSQDPIGLLGGEQLSQYVSDPVNWVDPLGLQRECGEVAKRTDDVILLPHKDKFGNVISRNPKSIQDQMTLEAAQRGEGIVKIQSLGDPNFKGMQKMELEIISVGGKKSNVHYVRDPATGKTMDFKFKKHSVDYIHKYEKG